MLRYIIFVFLLNIGDLVHAVSVNSKLGVINGESAGIDFAGNTYEVHRYLGIPYSQPPVGKLRFQKPKPVSPFDEPFDALKDGPICPQIEMPLFPSISAYVMSEDCLYLNVFVPVQEPDQTSGHAVLFFIHGGGFSLGSGSWIRGDTLASVGNVIVVTINYRLGLFGYLDMDDERVSGNFGFWDQHQALVWVNENIEAFGGDKDRVVIFGETAGAVSVTLQMLYPGNKGLFYGAIASSGTPFMPSLYPQNSIMAGKSYAEQMNCSTETNDEIIQCLQSCTHEAVLDATKDVMLSGGMATMMKLSTMPSIDGDFLKSTPFDLFEASKTENVEEVEFCRSIKLINGFNANEGAMFLVMQSMENMDDFTVSRESINVQIPGILSLVFGPTRAVSEVVTKMMLYYYTDWSDPDDPEKLRDKLSRFYGDVYYNVPAITFSRVHANSSNSESYLYHYQALTEKSHLPRPKWLTKANHGDELLPAFGFDVDEKLLNYTEYEPPTWEIDLSTRMMTYWSYFAKTGDPNKPITSSQSSRTWPKYELNTQEYLIFDQEDASGQFLYARETDFWNNLLPAVMESIDHPQTVSTTSGQEETCQKDEDCGGD